MSYIPEEGGDPKLKAVVCDAGDVMSTPSNEVLAGMPVVPIKLAVPVTSTRFMVGAVK